ncbi:MAG: hypothetical protein ACPGLY_24710 [Rubripirellula sp.]
MPDSFSEERANMDRSDIRQRRVEEVDLMLTNARLRDELEPYRDDSIDPSVSRMSLQDENEYLASMLAWERAPALPIASWFSPVMELPSPDLLDDEELSRLLLVTVEKLYSARVILRYTDHLSDRDLYKIIYRDILPCCEKKVELPGKFLEWRCMEDTDVWLRFYANAIERRRFQEEFEVELPPSEEPMYKRQLPGN